MHLSLIATVHDVSGKNKKIFEEYAQKLLKIYDSIYVTVSEYTNKEYIELIKEKNFNIKIIPKKVMQKLEEKY